MYIKQLYFVKILQHWWPAGIKITFADLKESTPLPCLEAEAASFEDGGR